MEVRPRIPNAPGLVWRNRGNGTWAAHWQARTDIIKKGFPIKHYPVWVGSKLSETDTEEIADRCRELQGEMLAFSLSVVDYKAILSPAGRDRQTMDTQQPSIGHAARTLFVTDQEMYQRLGVPAKIARAAIHVLDRTKGSGFPPQQALWGNRRYWPAIVAWFDRRYLPLATAREIPALDSSPKRGL